MPEFNKRRSKVYEKDVLHECILNPDQWKTFSEI